MQPLLDADLLQGFRDEVEGYLPAIRAAVSDRSRHAEASGLAHGIKGAARMVGLQDLAAASAALERCLQEAEPPPAEVATALANLDDAVREAFDQTTFTTTTQEPQTHPSTARSFAPGEVWLSDHEAVPQELLETFQQEAEELLAAVGEALRQLRADFGDLTAAEALRRHVHTLKGAAGMVGLSNASKLAHRLEDCLDRLRADASAGEALVDHLQAGADLLEELCVPGPRSVELRQRTLDLHRAVVEHDSAPLNRLADAIQKADTGAPAETAEVDRNPVPEAGTQSFRTPIERVDELLRLASELNAAHSALESRQERWGRSVDELGAAARKLQRLAERFEDRHAAARLHSSRRTSASAAKPAASAGFDELELDSYTELGLLVRDLAESAAVISGTGVRLRSTRTDLSQGLKRLGRLQAETQEGLMQLRMAPLTSLRRRLERTVRVTAEARQKQVDFEMTGDVELDKSVLDAVIGPLDHLLRNAVDHGIEADALRRERGKPARGRIRLRASLDGVQAAIELTDDGGGFDLEQLRGQAVSAGLLTEEQAPQATERQLHRLAFQPGMTTAGQVSEISGRGIGLDVVRDAVLALSGSVAVRSKPGLGSTFLLRLPTTLAAARLLLIEEAGQTFAIPLFSVTQVVRANLSDVELSGDGLALRLPGGKIPLIYLYQALGLQPGPERESWPALIVEAGEERYALAVERLSESRDAVIKSLGPLLRNVHGVTGATILGDGSVCMVLNPGQLNSARRRTRSTDTPASEQNPLRVLIVDDSLSVRTVAAQLIESYGCKVSAARDGLEALEELKAGESLPDALLLDVEMPRMDGYELLAALRASPLHQDLPVVMLTSRSGDKHRWRAMELGADAYLVKPFEPAELMSTLAKAIASRAGGANA